MNLTQKERDSLDDVFNAIYTKKSKYKMIKNVPVVFNKKVQLFYRHLFKELRFVS